MAEAGRSARRARRVKLLLLVRDSTSTSTSTARGGRGEYKNECRAATARPHRRRTAQPPGAASAGPQPFPSAPPPPSHCFFARSLCCTLGTLAAFAGARSVDLEVSPWAPTRLTYCISHPGHTKAYEPFRLTLCPARTPFRDLAAPESARMPPVCRFGTPRARSFDLEVTPWAPTRLTSCISHPGRMDAYEPLRSTLCPACAPFRYLAAPESARRPLLHTRGISRARSFDLEV